MDTSTLNFSKVPEGHRSGYVALIGRPNVGKSTLMNALLGRKLSIVTKKPQTTRRRVLGIHSGEAHQIIFLDTPGLLKPRYRLHEAMMHSAEQAIREADLLLFLAEAGEEAPDAFGLRHIEDKPALLVLTKMDLIAREEALPLVDAYLERRAFEDVIPTSAKKGFNLDVLLDGIIARLPKGPPFYPKDQVSEHPERFFVAEIIREKIFERYHEEIPYSVQTSVTTFQEREGENLLIDAEIVVNKESHKGIVIGKGGKALKRVGIAARKDIERFLGESIYLQLHVKTREGWRNRPGTLRSFGYNT